VPLNLTKYELSKRDEKLKRVIKSANIVVADGISLNWFSRRLGYKGVYHVTGIEFAEAILAQSTNHNWKIYLFGAHADKIEKALDYINKNFSGSNIVGAHDGYFNPSDLDKIIDNINSLEPDILFLGLGMPQKEYFIYDNFNRIEATFWLPVGGAFDIWAQVKKRSPAILQKIGLEWMQRSFYNKNKAKNVFNYGFSFLKDFLFYRR